MKEFDYDLDYKALDFTNPDTRRLYRIGRGEQGVLLVRPYTVDICKHWRFVNETIARESADKIYGLYLTYKNNGDFIGMDMCRKFLEMGFTRSRRYANHSDGRKYTKTGAIRPQQADALHNVKAKSAKIFKEVRDRVAYDLKYQEMRKKWRSKE